MRMGEKLGTRWPLIIVTTLTAGEAVSIARHDTHPAVTVYCAVLAAAAWAWHGRQTQERAVSGGYFAQCTTWDLYVRPHRPPADPTTLYTALAQRMRQTDEHVATYAARHGLDRISIALPRAHDAFADARSTRHRRTGHLWLGARWFHPRHTHHLPAVLEHELAHVRRYDTRSRLIVETFAVAATVLTAGLLPLPGAALTALTAWFSSRTWRWWSELACDAAAVRACGRAHVAAMWSDDLADEHAMPWAARIRHTLWALNRHPPLRLRRWFALHLPVPPSHTQHPLAVSPHPAPAAPAYE
ncbi:hypothetical protein [Streptomyces sp. ISL-86]|uniref:hypothetical protein n=1 Tax=Streptomyces sp. ISL-86 TaxID=2819187 RepID=UPI001BE7D77B|nr:hypothetical protein [Streptomyces sp. ISL-86]MBT2459995.1 hypothetical protein [Streptomyces sp. ISL-86]